MFKLMESQFLLNYWRIFLKIQTQYAKTRRSISPYLVRIQENTDQK